MEIKKFEAFAYKGPQLKDLTRKNVIVQLIDNLTESKFGGCGCLGSEYDLNKEFLLLYFDNTDYTIKFDLSDMGIEIGTTECDEKTGENIFTPETNLDTDLTKRIKAYKNTLGKFNI